ncbi:hypothetical protein CAPTEDRAFT_194855 [Capitella teleta]|uniref:Uncharacterized protein n=1 Tax=Capitella teleta TaxID=283909 RepID=R7T760_CAPTE|nr:hypothetical protein CAPTEDRAFT_194855 [Capitella teleta]|eukprot:ELT87215.1 hypothetical protein CAPTEDRAFT_194855 [Capitella teleta]
MTSDLTGASALHQTNSASLTKANQRIKILEDENQHLQSELIELRLSYKQLLSENDKEKFDERRINLLKSQLIQMERQVLLLSEALSSRSAVLLEVENALMSISSRVNELKGEGRVGAANVSKDELNQILQSAESARLKLYKNIEGKLESQLARLYKQLLHLQTSLPLILTKGDSKSVVTEAPCALYERLHGHVTRSCDLLQDATQQLLMLSLLVPAAPWPPLKKSTFADVTMETVYAMIPSLQRKPSKYREVVESLIQALQYAQHLSKAQNAAFEEEAVFHRTVYDLQDQYVKGLLRAISEGYNIYEKDINDMLCTPLKTILDDFSHLKENASERALRQFLSCFREHSVKVDSAIARLTVANEDDQVLSEYGDEYISSFNHLHKTHQKQRDQLISQISILKQQKKDHEKSTREFIASHREGQDPQVESQPLHHEETVSVPPEENFSKVNNIETLSVPPEEEFSKVHSIETVPASPEEEFSKVHSKKTVPVPPQEELSKLSERPPWVGPLDCTCGEEEKEEEEKRRRSRRKGKPMPGVAPSRLVLKAPLKEGVELGPESDVLNSRSKASRRLSNPVQKGGFELFTTSSPWQ